MADEISQRKSRVGFHLPVKQAATPRQEEVPEVKRPMLDVLVEMAENNLDGGVDGYLRAEELARDLGKSMNRNFMWKPSVQ